MTQIKFNIVFILLLGVILFLINQFFNEVQLNPFIFIIALSCYFLGQFSARFKKD